MRNSKKRSSDQSKYLKLRKDYFLKPENEFCKARLIGCLIKATDIHHTYDGSDRNEYYLDTNTWIPVCRSCHNWIGNNSEKAKHLNLLK